jgi:Mn-dependent transcriptional regulator
MNEEFYTVRGYEMKNYNKNAITSSLEDYLEMIYRKILEQPYIRFNTLAQLLNVNKSSVTKMVQKLGELGLVNYEKYGIITLTEKGTTLGKLLLDRHAVLEQFLTFIGCTEDALKQTELIEHNINWETVENIRILFDFITKDKDLMEKYNMFRNNRIEAEAENWKLR